MSAIAGIFRFDDRPDAADALARILQPLEPFGRDDTAVWDGGAIALGRRLTRALPEDDFDRQPMHDPEQGLVAVVIGRLDNRDEIAAALGLAPQTRRASSDGAMIFEAWRRWRTAALDRLLGAFTLAVWDKRRRELICARSPLSAPPLYWHRGRGFIAFASTPAALLALAEIPRKPDERRLARYLVRRQDPSESRTSGSFFEGIERLVPGHILRVDGAGQAEMRRIWSLAGARDVRLGSDAAYAEALREKLDTAVAACLRSTGPIGTQLSGGRDSSAVTTSAALQLAARGERLTAFTSVPCADYAISAPEQDESPLARAIAARYPNIDHVLVPNAPEALFAHVARGHRLYNRPSGAFGMVWLERIRDAAKARGIRVVLTGGHGNLGLSNEGLSRLGSLASSWALPRLLREIVLLRRREGLAWPHIAEYALPTRLFEALRRRFGRNDADMRRWSPASEALLARPPRDVFAKGWRDHRAILPDFLLSIDNGDWWNGGIAGWGIDERDPAADRRLIEFCYGLPPEQLLRDGKTRALYRRAFGDRLPAAVLDARVRGRQNAGWQDGLTAIRGDIPERLESMAHSPLASRLFDMPRLARLAGEWDLARGPEYQHALTTALAVHDFIRWAEGSNQ
ncbi:MAG TPA: asparagine synthase-related protein [Rhizomicrobium sp.]|jgi:asparagine synthase (glutamine-hydrolysing)|nr:asparagine synthase-related protein [Rhizomicrobium sp.]